MKQISGSGSDYIRSMTTDASGNIYVVGGFTGTIDFDPGPGTLTKTAYGSSSDVWMAKYTSNGALVWGNQLSGGGDDFGLDIALDNSGNIYITGYFQGTLPAFDLDPGSGVHQPAGPAGFFAKYNNNGGFLWAKTLYGGGSTRIHGLAVDGSANIYITGSLLSGTTVDFDPGSGTQNRSAANGQIFYAKYNSSGNYQWAKQTGTSIGNECWDLALDGSNNLYLTGFFNGTTDFNPDGSSTNYTHTNGSTFLSKYSTSGGFQWAKTISGQAGDQGRRCTTDASNNVYLTGRKISNGNDIFLAKYSSSGAPGWSFTINSPNEDEGLALFAEGSSYIYLTGYLTGTGIPINMDPLGSGINLGLPQYDNDFFVVKYSASNGRGVWARNLDLIINSPDDDVNAMRISNGKIVLAGNFRGSGDFNACGSSTIYSATTVDAFLTGFNTTDPALTISGPGAICNTVLLHSLHKTFLRDHKLTGAQTLRIL
jgi:hypothetical protein